MQPDPVGLSVVGLALLLCGLVPRATISIAFGCLAFSTTAIISLPSMGGAPVTVPQFGLLLFAWVAIRRRGAISRLNQAIIGDAAAQVLLLFTAVAVAGAFVLPRLMSWDVAVYSLARIPNLEEIVKDSAQADVRQHHAIPLPTDHGRGILRCDHGCPR